MPKTNYLEDEIIKHIFRTGSFTKPSELWIGLHTSDPGESGSVANEVSTSSTGYGRVQRDPADANWTATSGGDGQTDNAADIEFGTPIANWGSITHFSIHDAETGGNMLYYQALNNPKTVNNGDPAPKFNAGDLTVTEG